MHMHKHLQMQNCPSLLHVQQRPSAEWRGCRNPGPSAASFRLRLWQGRRAQARELGRGLVGLLPAAELQPGPHVVPDGRVLVEAPSFQQLDYAMLAGSVLCGTLSIPAGPLPPGAAEA